MTEDRTAQNVQDETFEALYERLQVLTDRLEAGELSLDQSVALYEEGVELARRCQQLLSDVEQRIERLRESFEQPAEGAGGP